MSILAKDYFDHMARNFPVMCASDEFYFFPRAKKASTFLHALECLDKHAIAQSVSYVKNLKSSLEQLQPQSTGIETQIDISLLHQSMGTFLREFGTVKGWQIDPTLYLKIAVLGINQIKRKSTFAHGDFGDNLIKRLSRIPHLLYSAKVNLNKIPLGYLEIAREMTEASIAFFKNSVFLSESRTTPSKAIHRLTRDIRQSLDDFKKFLVQRAASRSFIEKRHLLESIVRESFSCKKSPEEIFDIASKEYHKTLLELAKIAKKVDPRKSWQQILSKYTVAAKSTDELLALYMDQIHAIKRFLRKKRVLTLSSTQDIRVEPTPGFMKPIRASASYSCPLTRNRREPAFFYVTADSAKAPASCRRPVFNRIHNEYIFVTAHETYPGHHLLDSVRRRLHNPIRQQIESPLFYEGWASYAERLIDQLGYITNPLQRLVGLRRQAWRAVRAMLDVGVRIEKLTHDDAASLLKSLGYGSGLVRVMLRHYLLTPGYQLCYTIGKYEIDRLRKKFSSRFGLKGFHDILLRSGQAPFDLIEERMRKNYAR